MSNLRGQIGQKDKRNLCRQLGYFDKGTLWSQIGQKDKNIVFRHLDYFEKVFEGVN